LEAIMNTQQTLEQRILDALQPGVAITSAEVAALIEEAEAGIAKAEKEATVGQTLSLEPKVARQAIEDATFAANRLRMLLSKLQARGREVGKEERAKAWLAERDALKPERDALAAELHEVYSNAVDQIVDVLGRVATFDKRLTELNIALPPGVNGLLSPELHARGLDRFTRDTPSLLTSVCLFAWEGGRQIWPPPKPSMGAAFAAIAMPACDQRFTADWAKDYERRAAAQERERAFMSDYYARLTKEQEERQNAETREVFAASQRRNST
jgi:hypothetical protein